MYATPEASAPNYWDLTAEVGDQLGPLKVELLRDTSDGETRQLSVKVKNLDSAGEMQADDQPDSEDVMNVELIQVGLPLSVYMPFYMP